MPDPDDATEIGRLPLLTEVAHLHLRRRVTARVRVAVTTTAEDRQVEALRRVRQAEIHRVPMRREVEAPPPVRQEGDVVIIPVVEEEVVLVRRLVVTEEIHLRLRVEEVPVTLATQLARQVVTVTRLPPDDEPLQPDQPISGDSDTMTRTITAMFDTKGEADLAAESLRAQGAQNVRVHAAAGEAEAPRREEDRGILSAIADLFVPDDDRATYSEGLRRGSMLVSAEVADSGLDAAMDAMEAAGAVDLDTREEEWRGSGWVGSTPGMAAGTGLTGTTTPETVTSVHDTTGTNAAATTGTAGHAATSRAASGHDETIQLAEEQLRVGKRATQGGRVRVRSYVVETPVEQQVTLREEHVHVERHAADRPATGEEAALFRDRTIEAEESIEEAVVQKDVRVTGEVVVSKDATERTETIRDTVRRTEVDVDDSSVANDPARRDGRGAA
jgi:uncharacterized protein (TIGR02271 family)